MPSTVHVPMRLRRVRGRWSRITPAEARVLGRWLIWIQGLRCAYCGLWCPRFVALDHVVPTSRGGSDGMENLVAACKACNTSKGDSTPLHFLLRMRARYGEWWNFAWASFATGTRPPMAHRPVQA